MDNRSDHIDDRGYNRLMGIYSAVPQYIKQAVPAIYLGMPPLPFTSQRPWSAPGQSGIATTKGVDHANTTSTLSGISVGGADMAWQEKEHAVGGKHRRGSGQVLRRKAGATRNRKIKNTTHQGGESTADQSGKTRVVTLKNGRKIKMRNGRFVK